MSSRRAAARRRRGHAASPEDLSALFVGHLFKAHEDGGGRCANLAGCARFANRCGRVLCVHRGGRVHGRSAPSAARDTTTAVVPTAPLAGASRCMVCGRESGQESDRRKSRAARFQHHLVKPVDFHALDTALAETIAVTQQTNWSELRVRPRSARRKSLLRLRATKPVIARPLTVTGNPMNPARLGT